MTAASEVLPDSRSLRRLEVFLDVVFALVFFRILNYLPPAEDMKWASEPLGLLQVLIDHAEELVRILLGLALTLLYWNQSARLLRPLARTDAAHAALAIVQLVFVCFFMYFAISDPFLVGGPSSPALQSVSLALAGFAGVLGWHYARRHGLVSPAVGEAEQRDLTRTSFIEPVTAILTIPLAFAGPLIWTIGWLALPVALGWAQRRLRPRGPSRT